MFEVVNFSKPEFIPLNINDKVTWWSRRYKSWITGTVVEMTCKFRREWDRKTRSWVANNSYERIYVLPISENLPKRYPRYRLSFNASSLRKITE